MELLYALPLDPAVPPAPARVSNRLDLDELPVGTTRLFVELVGDGLATGIRVPIIVVKGALPGPVFGITACVHGNELNGIPVIHQLARELEPEALRGSVVGVVAVNVPGLHRHERTFSDGSDLNRIMPGNAHGSVGQVYAHRVLERIVRRFDLLLDLHTASFGRVNSLYVRADMTHRQTAMMAYLQRPQIIVHNPASDGTVRGAAMGLGIPAITVEIGDPQRWQDKLTESALEGARAVLAWSGLVDDGGAGMAGPQPVVCRSSRWMYTDRGGLLRIYPGLADQVASGQRVATVTNAFGDPIREYDSPCAGIVVGMSSNPVGQTGARIMHIGEVAPDDFDFLRRDQL